MTEQQLARLELAFLLAAANIGYSNKIPRGVLRAGIWAILSELRRIDSEEDARDKKAS